jgi:hypothetical protein
VTLCHRGGAGMALVSGAGHLDHPVVQADLLQAQQVKVRELLHLIPIIISSQQVFKFISKHFNLSDGLNILFDNYFCRALLRSRWCNQCSTGRTGILFVIVYLLGHALGNLIALASTGTLTLSCTISKKSGHLAPRQSDRKENMPLEHP